MTPPEPTARSIAATKIARAGRVDHHRQREALGIDQHRACTTHQLLLAVTATHLIPGGRDRLAASTTGRALRWDPLRQRAPPASAGAQGSGAPCPRGATARRTTRPSATRPTPEAESATRSRC